MSLSRFDFLFFYIFTKGFWQREFQYEKGWVGKKRATKVRGVRGSSSQEIHGGVKQAPLGDSPDCSARNAALSKPVSGAALSVRFILLKDDRVVASRKSVSPCHRQGRAPSSSVLFPKSSFSFPLLFSRVLSLHLSCLRLLAGFFWLAIKTFLVQHLRSQVNICYFMGSSPNNPHITRATRDMRVVWLTFGLRDAGRHEYRDHKQSEMNTAADGGKHTANREINRMKQIKAARQECCNHGI